MSSWYKLALGNDDVAFEPTLRIQQMFMSKFLMCPPGSGRALFSQPAMPIKCAGAPQPLDRRDGAQVPPGSPHVARSLRGPAESATPPQVAS